MEPKNKSVELKLSGFIEYSFNDGSKKKTKLNATDLVRLVEVKSCVIVEKYPIRNVSVKITRLTPAEIEKYTTGYKEKKSYSLRNRNQKRKLEPIEKPAKRICREITHQIRPDFIAAKASDVRDGVLVLANMRNFSPWPAAVMSLVKLKTTTNVNVSFFGDSTKGTVKMSEIGLIDENRELIRYLLTKKINNYNKAVLEMESVLNIPRSHSLVPIGNSYIFSLN